MSRDYSSRTGPAKKKKKPRGRARPAAKPKKTGPPGWVWLFCGLCIGLVIAATVYVFGRPAGSPGISIEIAGVPVGEKAPEDKEKQAEEKKKKEKPRFEFYEMLPNYKVVIPEEEYVDKGTGASTSESKSQATTPKVDEPGRYIIQAGSFSTYKDADRRKAGLALLGVESTIQKVAIEGGRSVYRVRSTPLDDLDKLNKTLKRLRAEGIDTLVMRYNG